MKRSKIAAVDPDGMLWLQAMPLRIRGDRTNRWTRAAASVFRNLLGAAEGDLIRAASSTQSLGSIRMKVNLKLLTFLILISVAILSPPRSVVANIGPISFDELVKQSDYILVGKVESVQSVEQVRVANIVVIRMLKGSPATELYYLARPTWICDISSAVVYVLRTEAESEFAS